jgi:peptidyl-prolyl cis-trans isomerase D
MLQRIREGLHGPIAWVILGLIGLTFVFWGGANSLDFAGVSNRDAVEVDGDAVPAEEAREQWTEVQSQWSQQFGTEIPAEQKQRMQDNILDRLALRKVIENRLDSSHFRVSDALVFNDWANRPEFQNEGKFDKVQAAQYLRQLNVTEAKFKEDTRLSLMMGQLQQGVGGSFFLTKAEAQRLSNLENEEREVQYVTLAPAKFEGAEPIDEAAIKAHYDKNQDRFKTIESVGLEYAELRLETVAAEIAPTDEDLRKYYEENRASYVLDERRRPRHIVIPVEGDDDAAALKQAESVLAEANSGKDFGELAKRYSKDATAGAGGDLGFVLRKDFPGPFGDTLFEMKIGEIRGPVKSQFGYHIIKLEEIQAQEAKSFEDVRAELESQYRQDHANDLFGTRQEEISRRLETGETDLDKLAKELNLARGSVATFLRGGGGEPLGSSRDLQQAIFGDGVPAQGRLLGPVGLGDDRLVVVKVTTHRPSVLKPLDEVREEIVAQLRTERGIAGAKAAAETALAKLEGGESLDKVAAAQNLSVEPARFVSRADPSIPAALRTALFEAPRPEGKPVQRTVALDDGSTAVFVVTRTRQGDNGTNPQLAQQQHADLVRRSAEADVVAYVREVKRKAKIYKNPGVFE